MPMFQDVECNRQAIARRIYGCQMARWQTATSYVDGVATTKTPKANGKDQPAKVAEKASCLKAKDKAKETAILP